MSIVTIFSMNKRRCEWRIFWLIAFRQLKKVKSNCRFFLIFYPVAIICTWSLPLCRVDTPPFAFEQSRAKKAELLNIFPVSFRVQTWLLNSIGGGSIFVQLVYFCCERGKFVKCYQEEVEQVKNLIKFAKHCFENNRLRIWISV